MADTWSYGKSVHPQTVDYWSYGQPGQYVELEAEEKVAPGNSNMKVLLLFMNG